MEKQVAVVTIDELGSIGVECDGTGMELLASWTAFTDALVKLSPFSFEELVGMYRDFRAFRNGRSVVE